MRVLAIAIAILSGGDAPQQAPAWLKLDQAKALSARTGKPVCAFIAIDPATGVAT